jgi:hypothetical protein
LVASLLYLLGICVAAQAIIEKYMSVGGLTFDQNTMDVQVSYQ